MDSLYSPLPVNIVDADRCQGTHVNAEAVLIPAAMSMATRVMAMAAKRATTDQLMVMMNTVPRDSGGTVKIQA